MAWPADGARAVGPRPTWLITHARSQRARFLGYEITTQWPRCAVQTFQQLHHLVNQYGEDHFWGLGIDGIRSVLDGLSVPDALQAHGLDTRGAPGHQR